MRSIRISFSALLICLSSCLFAQSTTPELEPGLALPDTGVVFTLSQTSPKPALEQIHPSEISANTHAGSNFMRSMVYAGPHRGWELKGKTSSLTFQKSPSVFYIRLGGDDPEIMRNRVTLVHLTEKKNTRELADVSTNIFGGQLSRHSDAMDVTKTDLLHGFWLKVTLGTPLDPGEYGIVFMPKDSSMIPDLVYDFSVAGDKTPAKK